MPSRLPPCPPPDQPPTATSHHLIPPIAVAAASFSLLLFLAFLYRKLTLSRTTPIPHSPHTDSLSPNPKLRRYRFSLLRKATSSFSPSLRLGQGGFGSVYKATLPSSGQVLAVKLMDSGGSLQAHREFQNELSLAHRLISPSGSPSSPNPFLVSILGYSSENSYSKSCPRKLLVYELMSNGSLQDKLFDHRSAELSIWDKRFNIILDVARALRFLHFNCGVVHGDIKPSNVLLDAHFHAKLGDFGLVKILDHDQDRVLLEVAADYDHHATVSKNTTTSTPIEVEENNDNDSDNASIIEETESLVTIPVEASPSEGFERASSLPDTWISAESAAGIITSPNKCTTSSTNDNKIVGKKKKKKNNGDYWWWKQDNGCASESESESGRVKDYVMEWIGSEISKQRPNSCSDLPRSTSNDHADTNNSSGTGAPNKDDENNNNNKKMKKKRWDWWTSWDEDSDSHTWWRRREKNRKPREWWKEEFCEELTKKNTNKKKKLIGAKSSSGTDLWWQRDEDFIAPESERKKRRRKSKTSLGSIDWWLDGFSGDRRNSQDWPTAADIPKSGGISSTPSMRGTVCYIAPEYGGGGQLSEKCDVYSFGVLVLVIIAGRRPLQVTASPMSEFERANLVSWARQLAYNGKLLDLVDSSIQSLDREQAMLCITIALLCIQRSPNKRPDMKRIVEMLTGESDPPHLPFQFSPSPPSNLPFKSRNKGR